MARRCRGREDRQSPSPSVRCASVATMRPGHGVPWVLIVPLSSLTPRFDENKTANRAACQSGPPTGPSFYRPASAFIYRLPRLPWLERARPTAGHDDFPAFAFRLRGGRGCEGKPPPPSANADQSIGAVRPQRGQTHSVTGSACEPLRPGCACWPAQRVRRRIGPCPLGHSFGSSWVSSFASAKSRTS